MTLKELMKGKEGPVKVAHKLQLKSEYAIIHYHYDGHYYGHYPDGSSARFSENLAGFSEVKIPKAPVKRAQYAYKYKDDNTVYLTSALYLDDMAFRRTIVNELTWFIRMPEINCPE